MEQYSHKRFNDFVAELQPNPDDLALIEQIVENDALRQSLLDWISQTTAERLKDIDISDNLFNVVMQLKGAELLDIYVIAFTAGRYYEKRTHDEFNKAIGERRGDGGPAGAGPGDSL